MIISLPTGTPNVILFKRIAAQDLCRDWECSFKIDITNELREHNAIFLYRRKETDLQFFLQCDIFTSSSLYASLQQYRWYYMPDRWPYGVAIENFADSKAVLEIGSCSGSFLDLAPGRQAKVIFHIKELLLKAGLYFVGLWFGRGEVIEIASIEYAARLEITENPEMQRHTEFFPSPYLCKFENKILPLNRK